MYSSTWLRTDTHSPAAIDSAPATREADPARRTSAAEALAPATAKMRQTLVTSPSLTPSTAARALPFATAAIRCNNSAASDAESGVRSPMVTRSGRISRARPRTGSPRMLCSVIVSSSAKSAPSTASAWSATPVTAKVLRMIPSGSTRYNTEREGGVLVVGLTLDLVRVARHGDLRPRAVGTRTPGSPPRPCCRGRCRTTAQRRRTRHRRSRQSGRSAPGPRPYNRGCLFGYHHKSAHLPRSESR